MIVFQQSSHPKHFGVPVHFVRGYLHTLLFEPIQGSINDWRHTFVYSKQLKTLSSKEKKVLKKYFDQDTQSLQLGSMDGIAGGWLQKIFCFGLQVWGQPMLILLTTFNLGLGFI